MIRNKAHTGNSRNNCNGAWERITLKVLFCLVACTQKVDTQLNLAKLSSSRNEATIILGGCPSDALSPAKQSVSQSVSQSVGRSVGPSVGQSVRPSVQWVSQCDSLWPVRQQEEGMVLHVGPEGSTPISTSLVDGLVRQRRCSCSGPSFAVISSDQGIATKPSPVPRIVRKTVPHFRGLAQEVRTFYLQLKMVCPKL